jgi:hypothetical protein
VAYLQLSGAWIKAGDPSGRLDLMSSVNTHCRIGWRDSTPPGSVCCTAHTGKSLRMEHHNAVTGASLRAVKMILYLILLNLYLTRQVMVNKVEW